MGPNCSVPADVQEFVYCSVSAVSPVVDTVVLLGGILVSVAIALAGVRLVMRLVRMSNS